MDQASLWFNRRHFLASASATASVGFWNRYQPLMGFELVARPKPKPVAAVVTVYRKNSHADVLVGKILEGWKQDRGDGPALTLASLYVDQYPEDDMSRKLAVEHGFRLCKTIGEAIELEPGRVAVDGVLCIGEHGDYPRNDKEQQLYPRRRFFGEIATAFERLSKVVPVFHDKHPGPEWDDAKWMYDRAIELKIPWMAGSSLVVSYRDPDTTIPWGSQLEACVAIGYSGLDIYGFHTLDFLQCIIERRSCQHTGVDWVQSFPVSSLPKLLANKMIDTSLLDEGLASSGTNLKSVLESSGEGAAIFMVHYLDGLLVPVVMLSSVATGISVACRTTAGDTYSTRVEERPEPRYPHFAYLLKGFERMVHTGVPAYPVERTMLTAGILDRALTSRRDGNQRINTPDLNIQYKPVDYGYAPHLELDQ